MWKAQFQQTSSFNFNSKDHLQNLQQLHITAICIMHAYSLQTCCFRITSLISSMLSFFINTLKLTNINNLSVNSKFLTNNIYKYTPLVKFKLI